jgi:hypothetical protein
VSRRRPWKGCRAWIAALMYLPAYGAWNVKTVAAGTGEALPGPMVCVLVLSERSCPITGLKPGSGRGVGRESEAAVVPIEPGGQQNRR